MKVLVALFCFAAVATTVSALECFVCNSAVDKSCADEFDAQSTALRGAFLKNCTARTMEDGLEMAPTYCKKVYMWLTGEYRVDRDCGYRKRDVEGSCFQTRADDHIVDTCQCDDDACNSGNALLPGLALLPVALGLVLH